MGSHFAAETVVTAAGEGRWTATIDPAWNLFPLPQGGVVTAIAARAMQEELGHPEQTLRTLHTAYVGQVAAGEVEIDVEVLRRGRTMSHLRATLANPGAKAGHLTTAIFGSVRDGFAFTDLAPPPHVPPPDHCATFRSPPPPELAEGFTPAPFWSTRLEGRPAVGRGPWDQWGSNRAERAIWYRLDEPPLLEDGTIDPLSLIVHADSMPGAVSQRVDPQPRRWFGPSIDLTVHLLAPTRSPWLLAHNTARWAGDGYASADMALWDHGPDGTGREPTLVAYATQLLLFTFQD